MRRGILFVVFASAALTAGAASPEQSPDSAAARVDKLFAEWDKTNSPGFGLAVSRNGTLVYEHGYGMANLELGVPITPASVFPAASISKQFTAMCILLLAERRRLSLDDEVKKFIPEWAYTRQPITIRHLLTHTSGLRDAFTLVGLSTPNVDNVNDAIAKALARQRELNFAPGTEFQYNNGGYNLLGTIVMRVSGRSLRDFADANIFKPLGMLHTHFHDDVTMLVPNRVSGYLPGESGFRLAKLEGGVVGNAGLYTTARDLLLWEHNFADTHVGGRTLVAEMQKPAVATDWGDGSSYGFGLIIGEYRGLRIIGHGGGDAGISTYVARFPDQGLAVAVLGNVDGVNPITLVRGVADIYLADAFPASTTTTATAVPAKLSLSTGELASKAGLYRDPTTEIVGRFFVRDGKLMASAGTSEENSVELVPLDTNRFVIPGTTVVVQFVPAVNGRTLEARETGVGPKPRVSRRLEPFSASSADLRAFAGEYESSELETTCTIKARDADLAFQLSGLSEEVLRPIFQDAFLGSSSGVIKFLRDMHEAVTGFTLNTSAVRALRFDRKKK